MYFGSSKEYKESTMFFNSTQNNNQNSQNNYIPSLNNGNQLSNQNMNQNPKLLFSSSNQNNIPEKNYVELKSSNANYINSVIKVPNLNKKDIRNDLVNDV